jgi:hypothetical protein
MSQSQTKFIVKVYSITLLLGVALGDELYIYDRLQHLRYDSNWDNPFANFIFFLLIGVGESVIPVFTFYAIVRAIFKLEVAYKRQFIYLAGFVCTIFPFVTFYTMVNEVYHRYNVVIYAVSCLFALTLSYWWTNVALNRLIQDSKTQNKI